MDNQANKTAAQEFAEAFARSLAESLTQAVGSPQRITVLGSPDLSSRLERPVLFRISAEGALRGECFLQLFEAQVAELGEKILKQPAAEFSEAHAEALSKEISTAVAGLAASLSPEYGEVRFKVERAADLAFGGMLMMPLAVTAAEQPEISMHLYFESSFLTALSSPESAKRSSNASQSASSPLNLKLVMDVELNVSLRFGQRQLPLREVLELASGSVIELDRKVDEPVELLLDGKVIALGEAVIVDGNYGLRVTEVPQPIASHLNC